MEEELFNDISLEVGGEYLDTDTIDEAPKKEETPASKEEKPTETKKEENQTPREIQDLIDTDKIGSESEEKEESKKEGETKDKKETEDSDKSSPDSPDDGNNPDDSSPSASVEPYVAFGNTLKEGGSFVTFNEEEFKKLAEEKGNPHDAFIEMQKNELEKAKKDYVNSLSDGDRELYEAKEAGVNLNEVGQLDKTIKSYSNLSDEYLQNQDDDQSAKTAKAVVKEYMRLRGFENDEIEETVDLYDENGTLSKRAINARDKIVDSLKNQKTELVENQKKEKENKQKEIETQKQDLKKAINGFEEIVPGIKINEDVKNEVYKDMTTPVAEDENGNPIDTLSYQRMKNPQAFDSVVYYLNRLGLFNFDENGNYKPDFSKITNTAETKVSKKLDQVLGNDENYKPKGKSNQNKEKVESLFDGAF